MCFTAAHYKNSTKSKPKYYTEHNLPVVWDKDWVKLFGFIDCDEQRGSICPCQRINSGYENDTGLLGAT